MPTPAPSSSFLKDVIAQLGGEDAYKRRLPPVESWNPAYCGAIDMRIARDGRWYYMGTSIDRPAMVKLFSTVLRREPDDSYVLVTPVEKLGIQVDDAPFLAVEMAVSGEGRARRIAFRTNVDDIVPLDAEHPLRVETDPITGEPSPYILVRRRLDALIARPVFYDLVAMAEEKQEDNRTLLGVWSDGAFYALGQIDG